MKKNLFIHLIPIVLTLPILFVSCSGEKGGPAANSEKEVTISGLSNDRWTYFSFENGSSVGTSKFLSDEEDKAWALRNDWDFAICGDYLKTNGGTSGNHIGGVYKDTQNNYLNIEEAPIDGYSIDEIGDVK